MVIQFLVHSFFKALCYILYIYTWYHFIGASQVALEVKNPPDNAVDIRDAVSIPGQEEPLEKGMATHWSIVAWRFP